MDCRMNDRREFATVVTAPEYLKNLGGTVGTKEMIWIRDYIDFQ